MVQHNIVTENSESTVVSRYVSEECSRSGSYQSEAALESAFIAQLQAQAYEHLSVKTEVELVANLRSQLEKLNELSFSDGEWDRLFTGVLANSNSGIPERTALIQEDHVQTIRRDDGTMVNIRLIDKDHIHNNRLQVINQYTPEGGKRENRYDVTVLVNGFPLVHIELKRRGVELKEAFNQINRYGVESFWAGSGLFEYVQLFVISNGTLTKYYSNSTRYDHTHSPVKGGAVTRRSRSHSFEFTSWWADAENRPIPDLMDFAKTFFAKHSLLNLLTRYCVFTEDKRLLAMRPYQIVATERILNRIEVATNYKYYGKVKGGGYIWHTTGSGKTLTSFKTAQLAAKLPYIDKVLFVVDRKDLDYQTMKEYDKFEKGAANSNTSTEVLKRQLESPHARIIITTIQKLSSFIKRNRNHDAFHRHVVIIFDECHRSQFGDMHRSITKSFRQYHLFGFTGTPIFAKNSSSANTPDLQTTEQAFGECLHTYTIVNAINDKNVLPFRVEYISTMKEAEEIDDVQVWNIDREKALLDPRRISLITKYILEHFGQKTKRDEQAFPFKRLENVESVAKARDRHKIAEIMSETRVRGFNSIFAVSSIEAARLYHGEFKRQMEALNPSKRIKVATIFSFGVNEAVDDDCLGEENPEDASALDQSSRDFLDAAIRDYNRFFGTTYDSSGEKFQNYYKDVSLRMKNREIDLLIVVNMFLTGFDATTLNTLWVDKNLKMHGLLQAYSRTNRILNSVKTFGNIVCFRNLEKRTNESIALFGDKEAGGLVLLRNFEDYYRGYDTDDGKHVKGYEELIAELLHKYPSFNPADIVGEDARKEFIRLYGAILKARNILTVFDAFAGMEILSPADFQNYQGLYLHFYEESRNRNRQNKESINDDIVFEIELVKQVEINIDYILMLIRRYHDGNQEDREIVPDIERAIDSSIELRNKKDLIRNFIDTLTPSSEVDDEWVRFVKERKREELERIIDEENLSRTETERFMEDAFRNGYVPSAGTAITRVLPPVSRFTATGDRASKRGIVLERLKWYFERFKDVAGLD